VLLFQQPAGTKGQWQYWLEILGDFSDTGCEGNPMIYVTRLNHTSVLLNCDLIEHIEATPDTVITLTTGQRITVRESARELIESVRAWHRSILIPEYLAAPRPGDMELPVPGLTRALDGPGGYHHGGI
jgi:flagellar protein FlbD